MIKMELAVMVVAIGCCACSSIYVGNVKFKPEEICSKEYASSIPLEKTACLPPARAVNAQSYFFERFRPTVSLTEVRLVEQAASSVSRVGVSPNENLLPSVVGRLFRAKEGDNGMLSVPEARGNMEFIPASGVLSEHIPTELQVSTNLSGVIWQKVGVSAELDAGQLLADALKTHGISFSALSGPLKDKLVAQVNYARQTSDAACGNYYFVSMKPAEVDKLVTDLRANAQLIDQAPSLKEAEDHPWSGYDQQSGILAFQSSVASAVAPAVSGVSASNVVSSGKKPLKGAYGLVIGAAIVRTRAGHSTLCSQVGVSMGGASTDAPGCDELKTALAEAITGAAAADKSGTPQKAVPSASTPAASGTAATSATAETTTAPAASPSQVAKDKAGSILRSLSIGYARATYKELDVNDHASVLAIQWLPVKIK